MGGVRGHINLQLYIALLSCQHENYFRGAKPEIGSEVYCHRCRGYALVQQVNLEWSIKCTTCKMGRRFGSTEGEAILAAGRHAAMYAHKVRVYEGSKERETITSGLGLSLVQSWLQDHPEHAQQLRGLVDRMSRPPRNPLPDRDQ